MLYQLHYKDREYSEEVGFIYRVSGLLDIPLYGTCWWCGCIFCVTSFVNTHTLSVYIEFLVSSYSLFVQTPVWHTHTPD